MIGRSCAASRSTFSLPHPGVFTLERIAATSEQRYAMLHTLSQFILNKRDLFNSPAGGRFSER